uniref:Uncharacterized protein MANES_03G071900 n=1 Tax=Rhizophora mucronata TaxID=61149 RepID=A0A2P2KJD9_RHIMU
MPREIPGYYYDAEKNRYFLLKGPTSGTSRASSSFAANAQKAQEKPPKDRKLWKRSSVKAFTLLKSRELNGHLIPLHGRKGNFFEEFQKIQVSQPRVWKYSGTINIGDAGLDQMHVHALTPEGQIAVDVLVAGSRSHLLSLFEVGKVRKDYGAGVECIPDPVWPDFDKCEAECFKSPESLWRPAGASLLMNSNISCIKVPGKYSFHLGADGFGFQQRALITTLGSEAFGGSLCTLDLVEPLDLNLTSDLRPLVREIAVLNCTVWTTDCNPNAIQAFIGTNHGAAMIDLESGVTSWVCQSKSDVLAQQLDQMGNVVLCGLRNGAIVTVDIREKPVRFSGGPTRHTIHFPPGQDRKHYKKWFELKGNIYPSQTTHMPSSVCCLSSLQWHDKYFLASSMDGSVKLYDHRMARRGAIQSYEGHVNSCSRLQFGVDQSGRFLVAGGEDCNVRLWSIKSGEMLFEKKFFDAIPTSVCWRTAQRFVDVGDEHKSFTSSEKYEGGAWLGSSRGICYMCW